MRSSREYIVIHYESTRFPARSLKLIRENGIKSGIALNPATPVEAVFDLIAYCDMILIMSVDPGFLRPVLYERGSFEDQQTEKSILFHPITPM